MTDRVIAIDGAAGSGKSTLAKRLAGALDMPHVDTGLMYRALTQLALDTRTSPDDGPGLAGLIDRLSFDLDRGSPPQLDIEGCRRDELRSLEVESTVSAVARHPEVRVLLREIQRRLGGDGAVVEGRDIGSVVFPAARVKLFLVADPTIRAHRRVREQREPSDDTATTLHRRDERDAQTNPFEPTEDAAIIDTSAVDADAVLNRALAVVADLAPELRARAT